MNILRSIRIGLVTGLLLGLVVAVTMTAWDWLENPGGIFRSSDGTEWGYVLDTLTSWLLPTFAWTAVVAFAVHLLVDAIRRRTRKRDCG